MLTIVLLVVLAIGLALGAFALFAPRRAPVAVAVPVASDSSWAQSAGDEFAGLSDEARCEMIFAVAALDDDASRALLERALDDRSEAVALAAAHALASDGRIEAVRAYAAAHPGARSQRILETTALLG
jgi:hypothetical protein